jgi:hypothetical protein
MADTKISALTSATLPLAGTEVLPIVQSGTTVKVPTNDLTVRNIRANATTGILQVTGPATASTRVMTVPDANFTAARTDAAQSFTGDQTLANGNLVIGTAGKGIDFSASPHLAGMTSELLNDYEEGTFIPTLSGATTTTYTTQTGRYTRIGRQIFFHCELEINSVGNGSTTIVLLGDLPTALSSPFSTISVGFFSGIATAVSSLTGYIGAAGANSVQFQSLLVAATSTAPNAVFANGSRVMFSGQYSV